MNFIRTFFDSNSNEELLSISAGQFLLLRSFKSPKSSVEYIFSDAMICVKRRGDYDYILHVERQDVDSEDISDGDSDDLVPDEMSLLSATSKKDDTWAFKIEEDLQFVKSWNAERHSVFIWNNTKGDDGDQFQYIIDDTIPLLEIEKFYKLVKHCTFEAKYRKPSDQATKQELLEFMKPEELDNSPFFSDEYNELRTDSDITANKNVKVRLDSSPRPVLTNEALNKLRSGSDIFHDTYRNSDTNAGLSKEVADTYDDVYDDDDDNDAGDDDDEQCYDEDAPFVDAVEYNS